MKRWKAIVGLMLALIYMPAASGCLLEMAGLVSPQDDCCEAGTSGNPAQQDSCPYGCCPIEYAVFFNFTVSHAVTAAPVAEVPVALIEAIFVMPPEQVCSVVPDASPPELPNLWQFSFRTALPPRAPSLAS